MNTDKRWRIFYRTIIYPSFFVFIVGLCSFLLGFLRVLCVSVVSLKL
jgi:hypothetical protein